MIILLDSNIILSDPSILAKTKPDVKLGITKQILFELRAYNTSIFDIAESAINNGSIKLHEHPFNSEYITAPNGALYKGNPTDFNLVIFASELNKKSENVSIATQDSGLAQLAKIFDIKILNLNDLNTLFYAVDVKIDQQMKEKAKEWSSFQLIKILISTIIPLIIGILIGVYWKKLGFIISYFPVWGTIIGIISLGILAFACRSRFRLSYGVFEFAFGIIFAVRVFWPTFDYQNIHHGEVLQIMAGIYIMVRGLDNIDTGIKGNKYEYIWNKLPFHRNNKLK